MSLSQRANRFAFCLVLTLGFGLLLCLGCWLVFGRSSRAPIRGAVQGPVAPNPIAPTAPFRQTEWTATLTEWDHNSGSRFRRLFVSRPKDRIRLEGDSIVEIGSLKKPDSQWLVLLPKEGHFFRWSEARRLSLLKDGSPAARHLFESLLDLGVLGTPALVTTLTSPSLNVTQDTARHTLPARHVGAYTVECVEYERHRRTGLTEGLKGYSEGWGLDFCPELGFLFSYTRLGDKAQVEGVLLAVDEIQEKALAGELFAVPKGYSELNASEATEEDHPVSELRKLLTWSPPAKKMDGDYASLLKGILPARFHLYVVDTMPSLRRFGGATYRNVREHWIEKEPYEAKPSRDIYACRTLLKDAAMARAYAESPHVNQVKTWDESATAGDRSATVSPNKVVICTDGAVIEITIEPATRDNVRLLSRYVKMFGECLKREDDP